MVTVANGKPLMLWMLIRHLMGLLHYRMMLKSSIGLGIWQEGGGGIIIQIKLEDLVWLVFPCLGIQNSQVTIDTSYAQILFLQVGHVFAF
jgi:hypothetical protein